MPAAPLPIDELGRLRALIDLDVLDTSVEEEFEALVNVAALVCKVPIGLVSLIDEQRQWFKANRGLLGVTETPREMAFCAHTILQDELLEVNDALQDPRFIDNTLVTADPNIRFYAGVPLRLSSGYKVGTLCVIDNQPRELDTTQRMILKQLAGVAVKLLEAHSTLKKERHTFEDLFDLSTLLVNNEARFRSLSDASPLGIFSSNAKGSCTYTNLCWQQLYDLSFEQSLGQGWQAGLHPQDKHKVLDQWLTHAGSKIEFDSQFRTRHKDGTVRFVHARVKPVLSEGSQVLGFVGTVEDVTFRVKQTEATRKSQALLGETRRMAVVGVGAWEMDLIDNKIHWSDETCRIHGVPCGYQPKLDEAINYYAPEARPVIQAAIEHSINTGESWDLELPFIQADGTPIWVHAVGTVDFSDSKPIRLVGVFQNITARVNQRNLVEDTNTRMALATDSGGIGIWELNLESGVLLWDEWMFRLYGLINEEQEKTYDLWLKCLHPEDKQTTEQAVDDAIASQTILDTEFRIIWSDGSVHNLRATARIIYDALNNPQKMIGVSWDVTTQRTLTNELAKQHQLMQVTLESIGDAVITTDAKGNTQWLNPVAERMTGWSTEEAFGRPLEQVFYVISEDTRTLTENPVASCLEQGNIVSLANGMLLISRSGDEFGIEDSAAPIRNAQGDLLGAVLVFHDVTEQRRLTSEMSYQANHDPLTGLLNRAAFETRLQSLLDKTHEDKSQHALMYIDLDQFKIVNDTCGHTTGDKLLKQVAKILRETLRSRDTLARLGGDEFGVILEHCSVEKAQQVGIKICDTMEVYRFSHDSGPLRIGSSIGLVAIDHHWSDTAAIMQAADTSCYAAKDAGRNRVHTWVESDQVMRSRHDQMQWATQIERALDDDHFTLYVQLLDNLSGHETGAHAEVLLRMIDSDGNIILPSVFIPAAERFHLASRIDRWVLVNAIDWLMARGPGDTEIDLLCINLSGQSVGDRAFHYYACEMLSLAGHLLCEKICIEITETAAITNLADASLFIDQLSHLGVKVALDDFGAGASSFGYLKHLSVNLLKIDGQFITGLLDDPLDDVAVRCFIDVARVRGLKTIAEWVDKPEILARVRALGIDYAQGFLLHKPMPIELVLPSSQPTKPAKLKLEKC